MKNIIYKKKLTLDDYTINEPDRRLNWAWTQLCDRHANLLKEDANVDEGIGYGICGVKGCKVKSDHYLDFDKEDVEEVT